MMLLQTPGNLIWWERYPEALGFLPEFLSRYDPRDAVEQLHENYAHGGGWNEFSGFTFKFDKERPDRSLISYTGDPDYRCKGWTMLRDEHVLVFEHDWVIVTKDGSEFKCARMD